MHNGRHCITLGANDDSGNKSGSKGMNEAEDDNERDRSLEETFSFDFTLWYT